MGSFAIVGAHLPIPLGIELIDPRTLCPFDVVTVVASVAKTNRLICVQEGSDFGSWGASVIAAVVRDAFDDLDAPPAMIGAPPTPIPYAGVLEDAWVPTVERTVDAVEATVAW